MQLFQAKFYSTPLDIEHRNVFDGGSKAEFIRFLNSGLFTAITIDSNKAVIDVTDGTVIVIPQQTQVMRDYNYCVLDVSIYGIRQERFYFVTNVETVSDVQNKQNCRVTLVWDYWANNLNDLININNYDVNYITRRHYQSLYEDAQGHLRILGYSHIMDFVKHKEYKYPDNTILWGYVIFSQDIIDKGYYCPLPQNGGIPTFYKKVQSGNLLVPTPSMYVPLGYVTKNGDSVIINEFTKNFRFKYYGTNQFTPPVPAPSPSQLDGLYCKIVKLTYNPPFNYEFTVNTDDYTLNIFDASLNFVTKDYSDASSTGIQFQEVLDKCYFGLVPNLVNYEKTITYETTKISPSNFEPYFSGYLEIEKATFPFYQYPYNYKELHINGDVIKLIQNINTEYFTFSIIKQHTTDIYYRFQKSNDSNLLYRTLNSNHYMILSQDSLTGYYNNNQASINANKLTTNLTTGVAMLAGKLGMVAHPALAVAGAMATRIASKTKLTAEAIDADNQIDMLNVPSQIGSDNALNVDALIECDVSVANPQDKKAIIYDLHFYGVDIDKYESIRNNYHYDFDFVQCENTSLPFIKNISDRENLEAMYNRGVTRWHINSSNKTFISKMNRDIVNLDKFLINLGG